jgi:sporulation protein YlmC with PRC-barrel domain
MLKNLPAGMTAILLAAPLLLSAQTADAADRPGRETRDTKVSVSKHGAGPYEADDIIGTRINDIEGRELGEIDQLLIDRSGKVTHVVIGVGAVGWAEKKVMVPWSDLKFAAVTEGRKTAITIDEVKLERAPGYERSARSDVAPAASPRTDPARKGSDRDGVSDRTDRAPLNRSKK